MFNMLNIFNSNVLIEIGEAIGNVGRKLSPRHSHADEMEDSFRRYLQTPLHLELPCHDGTPGMTENVVIEAQFRVVEE